MAAGRLAGVLKTRGKLPPRCWTHMLSNGLFGYLAADSGLGCMWQGNARLRRINEWVNDDLAVSGPEALETVVSGRRLSLFADADGENCRVTYGFGFARWEKCGASVTAFVPPGLDARVLLIERAPGRISWRTALTLAENGRDARCVTVEFEDGSFHAASPLLGGGGRERGLFRAAHRMDGRPRLRPGRGDGRAARGRGCCPASPRSSPIATWPWPSPRTRASPRSWRIWSAPARSWGARPRTGARCCAAYR